MARVIKDTEFDFYRWLFYGLILLLLALASIAWPVLLWMFAIVLIIGLGDMAYMMWTKYIVH
jgi:signal transduction histidine kinase